MENEELFKSRKRQIWQWCIITILAYFIVIQFSLAHCDNQVLANQFALASTISSIILSVIAIIMTVVSSDSLNNLLHKFRDLHGDIVEVPNKIDKSTKSMESASNNLIASISDMLETIHRVEKITEVLPDKLTELKSDINNKFPNAYNKNTKVSTEETETPEDITSSLLKYSSDAGILVLYAFMLCKKNNKLLDLHKFGKSILNDSSEYMYGYLVALSALNLIEFEATDDLELRIDYINDSINGRIQTEIEKRVSAKEIGSKRVDSIIKLVDLLPPNKQ